MCVMAVVAVAPCQCFSPGGNQTTSPGRISSIGPPQRCARPPPAVTIRVWPSGCVCQAVRAPGSNVTLAQRTRAGSGASNSGSMRTVPVNQSAGPLFEGCDPFLLISMVSNVVAARFSLNSLKERGSNGALRSQLLLQLFSVSALKLPSSLYLLCRFSHSLHSAFPRPRLLERREARRIHEIPVDMIHQCSVRLRFGLHLLPFRIGLESGPILLRLLAARMLQDVDKQILRTRRIFGRPIADALHVVPFEDRVGVITKARFESLHFALVNMIQAQFVNVVSRFRVGSAERVEREHRRRTAKKR